MKPNENEESALPRDFLDALPWYVNGTLDGAGRDRVERLARDDPRAARALQRRRALSTAIAEHAGDVPADLGWNDYAHRHGLDRQPRPRRRLIKWIAGAVIAGQAVVIAIWWPQPAEVAAPDAMRSPAPGASASGLLRVRLRASVTEAELRGLMLAIDARIVDGPSQLGDYVVRVPDERVESAHRILIDSPLVESVVAHR